MLFGEIRQPDSPYILVPKVSSEHVLTCRLDRNAGDVVANGTARLFPEQHYHLGVLASAMHAAWMEDTCGRMKSDYQYSSRIVYNNFPWPIRPAINNKLRWWTRRKPF